jgi:molybdate transport system substrate-binding protein
VRRAAVVALAALLSITACGDDDDSSRDGSGAITVFAASSLTDAFTEMAAAFEASNDGAGVTLNFGGSSSLREQILAGAPADVFASADSGDDGTSFASNVLVLAVPDGNPGDVQSLADLSRADLLVGLCAAEVPCGAIARRVLEGAGVEPSLDTEEPDVRSLLTKLVEGELDAGLVYRTDARSAGDAVESVALPSGLPATTTYPIAALIDDATAEAFVAFVLSDAGQEILASHGFGPP